jgi:hypothetical protein
MRQKSGRVKESAEPVVKEIRRATRRHFSAQDKIRIVLEGLRSVSVRGIVFDQWPPLAWLPARMLLNTRGFGTPSTSRNPAAPFCSRPKLWSTRI